MAAPLADAYRYAGYRAGNGGAVRASASRLAKRPHIRAALLYIQRTFCFFNQLPEDIANYEGYGWLRFLRTLPVEPSLAQRRLLALTRSLDEARRFFADG